MDYSKLKFDIERSKIAIRTLCLTIGITEAGFYRFIKKENMYLNVFESICKELKLNPNDYFELEHLKPLEIQGTGINDKLKEMEKIIIDIRLDLTRDKS